MIISEGTLEESDSGFVQEQGPWIGFQNEILNVPT